MKKMKQFLSLAMATIMIFTPLSVPSVKTKAAVQDKTVLAGSNTTWKYLDDNTDPGEEENPASWTLNTYDDGSWKSGKGSFGSKGGSSKELGGGFTADNLLQQYMEGTTTDIPAYFFRTTFNIDSLDDFKELTGELQYDDAAIVYINGIKVAEFDVPEGGFDSNMSYGGSNASNPRTGNFTITNNDIATGPAIVTGSAIEAGSPILVEGDNVMAVELHQGRANSSDIFLKVNSVELIRNGLLTDGFDTMEAENCSSWSAGGLKTENSTDSSGGTLTNVGGTYDSAWLQYNDRYFEEEPSSITFRYVNNSGRCASDARMEIRLDGTDGEVLQTVELPATGSNWNAYSIKTVDLTNTDSYLGKHTLCFVMRGTTGTNPYIMNLDYIKFNKTAKTVIQKAVSLNIGENETERNITWYADDADPGHLQLALKSDMIGEEFPTENYREFTAGVQAANDTGFYSNQLTMDDLTANTEYVYRLINKSTVSEVYNFKTGALGDFSFLLAGDPQIGASGSSANDSNGWENTLRKSLTQFTNTDFIISAGDQVNSAADESQYAGYLNHDALSSVPVATVVGNHDTSNAAYKQHFNNPNVSSYGASTAGSDYWYTYNNVLFLNLNSNNLSTAEHKAFMEEAINLNPDVTWKVVVFHHSIYSVANHAAENDILQRREEYAPVFKDLGIDVVLMGHDHVYVRSYMMDGLTPEVERNADNSPLASVTDPDGILYVTANSASGSKFYTIQNQVFPYSAVQSQENVPNISNIEISPTSFKITTYRITDMSVVDTFEILHSKVLTGVITPENITGVVNGTEKTAQALGLPETVTITTEEGNFQAEVQWDAASSSYDSSNREEQTFTVQGTVILPVGVGNPGNISLDVTITVTVGKASQELKSLLNIKEPEAVTGIKNGTAKTVEALRLPGIVTLVTDKGEETAQVVWDVVSSSYDPSNKEEQTFMVQGTVILPDGTGNPNNISLDVTITVMVNKASQELNSLLSIKEPVAITDIKNGTAKTAEALRLPETVTLVTDKGEETAQVIWDVVSSSYDPSNKSSQTFIIYGVVTLPADVVNTSNIDLSIPISVTVKKKTSSSGGNSSNSSGSKGGSDSDNSHSENETRPQNQPHKPVTENITVKTSVDKNGLATAAVSETAVTDAITKAVSTAGEQGKTEDGIEITLSVSTPDTAKSLGIVLTQPVLNKITANNVRKLKVDGKMVSLNFDKKAIDEIRKQSNGNVNINVKPAENLSEEAKAYIKDRIVYDIDITYVKSKQTQAITSLEQGMVSISIPYTLSEGKDAGKLFAAYVNDNGKVTLLTNSSYDANTSSIIFTTGHFSVYGVAYQKKAGSYTDIVNHPAKESIDFVASRDIFSGQTDSIFGPETILTYGTLAKAFAKLDGADISKYKSSSFTDLENNQYKPYIEWAYKKGIMTGEDTKRFAPDRIVTREQFAVLLEKYVKASGFTLIKNRDAISFQDAGSISGNGQEAVKAILQAGIMDKEDNNQFYPLKAVTYAEAALALHRYAKLAIDPQTAQGWALNDAFQKMYYKDGKILTGWQNLNDNWYYFYSDGSLAVNTWIDIYQVDNNGKRVSK
ncbi:S-layer homology domain-containing protein [Anaerocolumna sp. MB42-C2]|uniref:S-layer homology domain-containing protein n=1 Tax=Anaerocolumna sp. MB42-C2 TaxID=3070997 RepID=UPI0027E0F76E|nr:S-layer homology domain-containing protein [Anaerocolumna sp. MB42-C2]WMJ87126.1 S-layer homology domain-containing protein [Anaerocolumna sp. MB42-C2]